MSAWKKIVDKAFHGNPKVLKGKPNVETKTTTGAPSAAKPVGTLVWNSFDGDAYICTVSSGTYVKINA